MSQTLRRLLALLLLAACLALTTACRPVIEEENVTEIYAK